VKRKPQSVTCGLCRRPRWSHVQSSTRWAHIALTFGKFDVKYLWPNLPGAYRSRSMMRRRCILYRVMTVNDRRVARESSNRPNTHTHINLSPYRRKVIFLRITVGIPWTLISGDRKKIGCQQANKLSRAKNLFAVCDGNLFFRVPSSVPQDFSAVGLWVCRMMGWMLGHRGMPRPITMSAGWLHSRRGRSSSQQFIGVTTSGNRSNSRPPSSVAAAHLVDSERMGIYTSMDPT